MMIAVAVCSMMIAVASLRLTYYVETGCQEGIYSKDKSNGLELIFLDTTSIPVGCCFCYLIALSLVL